MQRRFHQLDVFSAVPLKGNPLAVVHAAQGLSDDAMAAFARWTNLSETTFLLPPLDLGADYRVRIRRSGLLEPELLTRIISGLDLHASDVLHPQWVDRHALDMH